MFRWKFKISLPFRRLSLIKYLVILKYYLTINLFLRSLKPFRTIIPQYAAVMLLPNNGREDTDRDPYAYMDELNDSQCADMQTSYCCEECHLCLS